MSAARLPFTKPQQLLPMLMRFFVYASVMPRRLRIGLR
jgi:hypothetical protein